MSDNSLVGELVTLVADGKNAQRAEVTMERPILVKNKIGIIEETRELVLRWPTGAVTTHHEDEIQIVEDL